MEKRIIILISLSIFTLTTTIQTNEFVKTKKKPAAKVSADDCCYQTLPVMRLSSQVVQELGKLQTTLTDLAQGVIENDKKSPLKRADQNKLQEFISHQEALEQELARLHTKLKEQNDYLQAFAKCLS